MINNSEPLGSTSWFQGRSDVFPAHEGAADSYIAANFDNAVTHGTISNWLITPVLTLRNGDTFSFWTRQPVNPFADRMEVRMSTAGASVDVGDSAESVGDFTHLLLSINPDLQPTGYPQQWTRFEVMVRGVDEPTTGRLAFRYFVPDAGLFGSMANYVGIDTVAYTRACSTSDVPWLSVSATSGTTAPGDSTELTLTFDSTGLVPGEYHAQLCITTNDPLVPRVTVPVTLTVVPGFACDTTITGTHAGPLVVSEGITSLAEGAEVSGPIRVEPGAGLFAEGASVNGPVSATDAAVFDLRDTTVTGPVSVSGTTYWVAISGSTIRGPVNLTDNTTGNIPIVVAGNTIAGPLSCSGNEPPPVNDGVPNQVTGPMRDQCADL